LELIFTLKLIEENVQVGIRKNIKVRKGLDGDKVFRYKKSMTQIIKVPAQAKEIVKNRRTGQVYADKAAFDADVADPATDTTVDDFQQDLEITVASVTTKSDSSL
jgi:hypothetical protein